AHRWRLIRQFLTESMVLALIGGIAALLATAWTAQALRSIRPERTASWGIRGTELFNLGTIGVDWRVFAFTVVLSIVTGLLFGLAPAIGVSRPEVSRLLRDSNEPLCGGRRLLHWNGRMLLAVGEICLALILLVGAGLLLRSFARMTSVDLGFDPQSVLTLRLDPSPNKYTRRT